MSSTSDPPSPTSAGSLLRRSLAGAPSSGAPSSGAVSAKPQSARASSAGTPPNLTRSKARNRPELLRGEVGCEAGHVASPSDRFGQVAVGGTALALKTLGPLGHPLDVVDTTRERGSDGRQRRCRRRPDPGPHDKPWQLATP